MFSNIVVAWDGSQQARHAFDYGLELATRFASHLRLVGVAISIEYPEAETLFLQRRSEELVAIAQSRGLDVKVDVLWDMQPAKKLLAEARRTGVDLIVVGRKGTGPMASLIGNVSSRLSRDAPCPVLVIGET